MAANFSPVIALLVIALLVIALPVTALPVAAYWVVARLRLVPHGTAEWPCPDMLHSLSCHDVISHLYSIPRSQHIVELKDRCALVGVEQPHTASGTTVYNHGRSKEFFSVGLGPGVVVVESEYHIALLRWDVPFALTTHERDT